VFVLYALLLHSAGGAVRGPLALLCQFGPNPTSLLPGAISLAQTGL
jgi:hypothetical protein